jgi:hypothetical protein
VDFQTKNKEKYFIMIKALLHLKGITVLNFNAPNNRTSKYMKQKLIGLKEETNKCTRI